MGDTVSREQLLSFFMDSCYLLDGYKTVEKEFITNNGDDELNLDDVIQEYRETQNFKLLIPILIGGARYYLDEEKYNLAAIYLIECQCILEELDSNSMLKGYLFAELGYLYAKRGIYQEADYYYTHALNLAWDKEISLLSSYCIERLIHVLLNLWDRKSLAKLRSLVGQYNENELSDVLSQEIQLLSLYLDYRYNDVLMLIDELSPVSHLELESMKKAFKVSSLYCLGRQQEIEWELNYIDYKDDAESCIYYLIYNLTLHLCYDSDEELIDYIDEVIDYLQLNEQYCKLKLVYYFLCHDKRVGLNGHWLKKFQRSLRTTYKNMHNTEDLLKHRTQNVYHSYRQYYSKLDLMHYNSKYKVVSWKQLPLYYRYEYTDKTVVGYLKLHDSFYGDFKVELQNRVIEGLNEFIGETVTFSLNSEGVWFYFKACCGEMKLKQKLNRLLQPLYEKIGKPYFVSFCLPRFTSEQFEVTMELVRSNFYEMVVKSDSKQRYEFNFCYEATIYYGLTDKLHRLLNDAYIQGAFRLECHSFYHRDDSQLFGVECKGSFDEGSLALGLTAIEQQRVQDILTIEEELFTFYLGCKYLNEHFKDSAVVPSLFIKLSRETLLNKFLAMRILSYLNEFNVKPQHIIISVKEDILFEKNILIEKVVQRFHEIGINIALDEYGTGSLTGSIRNLNINYLRISPCLIQYLRSSENCLNMMKSLLNVCSNNDVKICCSDIESESSHHFISDFGIDVVGGSYYQRKLVV